MKQYIISTNFSSKKLNLVCFEGNKKIQEEEISLSDLKNNIDHASIIYLLLDAQRFQRSTLKKKKAKQKRNMKQGSLQIKKIFL